MTKIKLKTFGQQKGKLIQKRQLSGNGERYLRKNDMTDKWINIQEL